MSNATNTPVIELKVRIHPLDDGEFHHRVQVIGDSDLSNSPYMKTMQVDNLTHVFEAQIEAIEHIRSAIASPPETTDVSDRLKATALPPQIYELVALAQADDLDTDAIQQVADRIRLAETGKSAPSDDEAVIQVSGDETTETDDSSEDDSDESESAADDTSDTDPLQDVERSPGGYWLTDTDDTRLTLTDIADRIDDSLQKRLQGNTDLTFTSLDKAEQMVGDISQALQAPIQLWRNDRKYKRVEPADDSPDSTPADTASKDRIPPKRFQPPFVLVSSEGELLKDGQEYDSKGGAAQGARALDSSDAPDVHVVSRPTGEVYKTYHVAEVNGDGEPVLDVIDRPGKTFDLPAADADPAEETDAGSQQGSVVKLFQDGTRRIMKASDPDAVQNAQMDNQMFLFADTDEARQVAQALASHDDRAVTLKSDSLTETVQP